MLFYADDNLPYTAGINIGELAVSLEEVSKNLFNWFGDNPSNPDTFHLVVLSLKEAVTVKIGKFQIESSKNLKTTRCALW